MLGDLGEDSSARQQGSDALPVRVVVLDGDSAADTQPPRDVADHRLDDRQPVLAAEERDVRIVVEYLRIELGPVRNVRRVRDDHVHRAVEVGQQLPRSDVSVMQRDRRITLLGTQIRVAPGPRQRRWIELDGVHDGIRACVRDGQRQRARPRAQVQHHGRVMADVLEKSERPRQQQLGFGTWNEHPGTHLDIDVSQ